MLSFISKILSQHVALLAATRRASCRNTHFSVLRTLEMLHTFAFRAIDASPHWFVATRRASCRNTHFSVLRTPEMLHTFAFRAIDASPHRSCRNTSRFLSQHAFLRASHSRNAAYIRIPGYRCFSVSFLPQHVLLLVATRISPCFALSKCCIHSHSGLSPYLLMYVCSANRQSTLPASSHVPCDYRTIATSSSRGMCKLHPYAR